MPAADTTPPRCARVGCGRDAVYSEKLNRHIRECAHHQNLRLNNDSGRRQSKAAGNTCMACSLPRDTASIYCATHRQTHAARMRTRRTVKDLPAIEHPSPSRIDSLTPDQRRHFSKYCGVCGVFRVTDPEQRFCSICDVNRTACVEYKWHEAVRQLAQADGVWPPFSSTFSTSNGDERLVCCDMVFLLPDRLIVLECDEFSGAGVEPLQEMTRMASLHVLPTVVLRFNPHQHGRRLIWTTFGEHVEQFWQRVRHYLQCPTPQMGKIMVVYCSYETENPHVIAAMVDPRFVVESFSPR